MMNRRRAGWLLLGIIWLATACTTRQPAPSAEQMPPIAIQEVAALPTAQGDTLTVGFNIRGWT